MSASFVQNKSALVSSAASISVSLTGVTSGNHLNAAVFSGNGGTSVTTSTPSATWNRALVEATHFALFEWDYTENVASGSWTVQGNVSASGAIAISVSESAGVATSSSLGVSHANLTNAASTTIQPGSITPSAGSILYSAAAATQSGSGTNNPTIDSSFTLDTTDSNNWLLGANNFGGGTSHLDNASGAAVNPTWTAGGNWGVPVWSDAWIIEFVAASGGGAAPIEPPMRTLRGIGL